MNDSILFQNAVFCVWLSGSDLTFERVKNGESFTLFCELRFCTVTELLTNVIVYDYDGCFDFDRNEVEKTLTEYYSGIEVDFSEL